MEELTVILLGKQGAGKSASGNTLLGSHAFHTTPSSEQVTQACSMSMSTVDKQIFKVIDTPGWCDSSRFETEMKKNIIEIVIRCMPHVFLLVLPIGRFTNEDIKTVMNVLQEFGDEVTKYMIVLFTKGDELEQRPIEDYLKELHSDLKAIIQVCGGRYHVFNNRNTKDRQQVSLLLKKMKELVGKNEQICYTETMYNKNKKQLKNEVENFVPENRKIPAENENRYDGQVGSCDADEEKGEKEETELDKIKKKMDEFLNGMAEQEKHILKLERELKIMQGELDKTKQ
ncbi:GTPase IMAP family member 4-like [Garra rufa]|uniref:GTPase IMAP family member 4-like n=1 Tax=Garra rufa TaxID=137080 RepID=UPI003CCEBD09